MSNMGRPKKEIDIQQLTVLCRLMCSLKDCADFFHCSVRTIEQHLRDDLDMTFRAFREQSMIETRLQLRRTALDRAKKGSDIMLIFCLKNLDGWKDKNQEEIILNIPEPIYESIKDKTD